MQPIESVCTNRVIFVGDPHLDSSTPVSRIDNYSESSLEKLDSLLKVAISTDTRVVIFLGDMFSKHEQTNTYLSKVILKLKEFQSFGIYLYSIVGNHDLSYERIDTLERSPLNLLFLSGIVKHLTVLDLNDQYLVRIVGLDYPDQPMNAPEVQNTVLVAHRFYGVSYGDDPHSLSIDQCDKLGYKVYVLGHDHKDYGIIRDRNYWVIRPGSFMRTSAHSYNLYRDISVAQLIFEGTKELPVYTYRSLRIDSRPSREVFSEVYYYDHPPNFNEDDEETDLETLLSGLKSFDALDNIRSVLDGICSDSEIKSMIGYYLNLYGI